MRTQAEQSATALEGSGAPLPVRGPGVQHAVWAAIALLATLGLFVRVAPLLQGTDTLLRRPTEDGYLMLTVSRNIALGRGMSIAEGTIPTNGVQPLATGLFALCFWVLGGDRVGGVALVMWLSTAISVAAALVLYRVARRLLHGLSSAAVPAPALAGLAAAFWFASPIEGPHSVNGLETGLCFLASALAFDHWFAHAGDPRQDLSWRRAAGGGALLALAFWARNDCIFLGGALAVARVGRALPLGAAVLRRRLGELAVAVVSAGVLTAPWMVSNYLRFGSIVPVSGSAQSLEAPLGSNLIILPAKMAEHLSLVAAIPQAFESQPAVALACTALLAAAALLAARVYRTAGTVVRTALVAGGVHTALLATYYGVFFGAPHFLSRYTAPVSLLMAVFVVAVAAAGLPRLARPLPAPALAVAMVLAIGLGVRTYRNRHEHMHFQVVEWVAAHTRADTWVGAVQTGTLGFFHDRTINLDGKTNPRALEARKHQGMRRYILESPIEYIVDWAGVADWQGFLGPDFVLRVRDEQKNLSVLERKRV